MSRVILKKISIIDIDCDCVVNAANKELLAGGGVCGLIFKAAGYEELTKACSKQSPIRTGAAAITPAFNMKQKFIIHAVGPVWTGGRNGEELQLKSAYRSSLDLAVQNNCHSIAFPLISTGIYGYPKPEAWKAALEEVYDFLKDTRQSPIDIDIYFTSLDDETLWMGKEELDRQQARFDSWCAQMDQTPPMYDDPEFIEKSMNIPYLDPELLYAENVRTGGPYEQNSGSVKDSGRPDDFVFFWNDDEENGYLSQWYRAEMSIDGVTYTSCEQYMMAKKALAMGDAECYILIMHESEPAKIKKLGREVRNFDSEKWSMVAPKIIYDGNLAKFSQNEDLRDLLLGTGQAKLAEASPKDKKYGIGLAADDPYAKIPSKWKGENLMGETLMRVRAALTGAGEE